MRTLFNRLWLGITLLFVSSLSYSQNTTLTTTVTPPYSKEVESYPYSTQVLVQSTVEILSASLRVTIKGDNGITLRTPNNYLPVNQFDLLPNVPKILTGNDLSEYFNIANLNVTGISANELQQNGLPPGQYKICFRLLDSDYQPVTAGDPTGCSITFEIKEPVTTISTIVTPPFGNPVESYANSTKIIINSEQTIYSASLRISIKGDNGIILSTPSTFYNAPQFDVTPLVPVILTGSQLSAYFDLQNLVASNINSAALKQTGLPPGHYKICVRLIDSDYIPVTTEDPTGCSALFEIKNAEPPQLLTPQCNTAIPFNVVPNILFSWTPAIGAPVFTRYTLKIVEMLDTTVSPANAMQSATTPPFFEQEVTGYSFLYGPGQPMMDPDKKYAWQVIASDEETNTQFQNEGKSAVCSFSLQQFNGIAVPTPQEDNKNKTNISPVLQLFPVLNIPYVALKGKLEWAFPKTEEGAAVTESVLRLSTSQFNQSSGNVFFDPNAVSAPGINQSEPFTTGGASGKYYTSDINQTVANIFNQQKLSVFDKQQNAINALAGTEKHPLSKVKIDFTLWIKDEVIETIKKLNVVPGGLKGPLATLENEIFIGSVTTNEDGTFQLVFIKSIPQDLEQYYNLDIDIKEEHFDFPTISIPIEKDVTGGYTIGTLTGLAKAYRFKPIVKDQDGNTIETAKLTIVRDKWWNYYNSFPNLKWEGNRNPDSLSNLTYVADGKNTNVFKRMFMSLSIFDYYLLKVEAEGYTTTQFYFSAGSGKISTLKSGVTLVEKVFTVQANDPMVKGRVISKETEIPISNVTVTVKSESGKTFSAQTGSDGRFTIANIPVNDKPYALLVNTGMGDLWQDPNLLYLNKKGIIEVRDPLLVEAQLYTVKGVVANIHSDVLNQATVTWASGGKPVFTNEAGLFVTAHPLGKDTLIVSKDGYRDARVPVDLKKSSPSYQVISDLFGGKNIPNSAIDWTPILNIIGGGNKDNTSIGQQLALDFGYVGSNSVSNKNVNLKASDAMVYDLFGNNPAQSPAPVLINLDTIKLKKFYVQVTVKDAASNAAIVNAKVKADIDKPDVLTDSKGVAILEDVSYGTPVFYIYGPSGSAYIPLQQQTTITASEDTAKIVVQLEKGALVSGKVTSSGAPVQGAKVFVVGMDFIFSLSDSSGNYQMPGIQAGTHTLRAVKSGYIADEKAQTFLAKNYTINFNITKPDFDASKLLGFDVQLYHVTAGSSPDEFTIDGAFVNLPANGIFSFSKSVTLEFPPLTVVKNPDGSIQPKAGKVVTLTSNLPLKVLNFLDVIAYNSSGLQVLPQGSNMKKGVITATIKMDMSSPFFSKTSFLKYPSALQLVNGSNEEIAFISSDGTIPNQSNEFQLKSPSATWTIYNVSFTANLPQCKVSSNGIDLKGSLSVNNIPGLGNTSLQVDNCNISTSGELKAVNISVNPNPVLNLYSWALKIKSATLNQFGFKFGGDLSVKVPSTNDMNISFSNLTINSSGITGGVFYLPGNISIMGIVGYSAPLGNTFQLGKVPGKNAYRLTGTGSINFAKYLTSGIPLESFSIATDGNLEIKAKPEISYDIINIASFNISGIEMNTAIPEVAVTGKINLYIPGFNTGAGGKFHFKKSSFASIDDISFNLSIGAIGSVGATTSFTGSGFKGSGKLKIANSGVGDISASFSYEKPSSGIKLTIGVVPGLPPIPLVGTVSLENIGGKVMLNTSNNVYAVTLSGRIVVAPGTSAIVSLDPIAVTVSASAAGPVIQGDAYVKIISWNIGKAEFRIDYPNRLLFVKESIEGGFNLLPGVSLSGKQELVFTASAKSGDMYWFAGMYADVNMIGDLVKGNGSVVLAWGLSKYGHPEFSEYTNFIPDESLDNGRIYGVNVYANVSIGVKKEDADCADFTVGKICGYAYTNTKGLFYSNLMNGTIGVSIASVWEAAAWAEIFGFDLGGLAASASGELGGGHDNARGWWFSGKASGSARAWAGCCGSGCGTKVCWGCCVDSYIAGEVCPCPCGAKICASVSVNVDISEKQGSSVGIDLF